MDTDSKFAPYAAPENVLRVLDRLHASGVKGPIDGGYLTQIGIGEGMIPRTLRALEFLGFLNPDGTATALLLEYITASPEEAPGVLDKALRAAYAVIFRAVEPTTADRTQVWTAFKTREPSGQWTRMVTLFLALCQAAGMEVKEPPSNRPGKLAKTVSRKTFTSGTIKTTIKKPPIAPPVLALPPATPRGVTDPALAAWAAKLPELTTVEDFDEWVIAYRALLTFVSRLKTA